MPELPEVDYARRQILRDLVGRPIAAVDVRDPGLFRTGLPGLFPCPARALVGKALEGVVRLGKHLLAELDGGETMLWLHLGMSGRFIPHPAAAGPAVESGIRLTLSGGAGRDEGGRALSLRDPRRLARAAVGPASAVRVAAGLDRLGPDAWALTADPETLGERLRRRRGALKSVLLDQAVLAGVGNIQATEALHAAGLDPWMSASGLDTTGIRALAGALDATFRRTLDELERTGGRYVQDDRSADHAAFRVYGRRGEPCPGCGTFFQSRRQAGRTTTWCPTCQPPAR